MRGNKRARPVPLLVKPSRVYTLLLPHADKAPTLPIQPAHGRNAFLEEHVHDWSWRDGVFHYYSRIANEPVWLLLEYAETTVDQKS